MTNKKKEEGKKITSVEPKIEVVKSGYKIKAKGVFNLEDLYMELQIWFEHMGYSWKELEYKIEALKAGESANEFVWVAEKEVNKYSTFVIELSLMAIGMNVEVQMENGAKAKRFKGSLEFRSEAYIKRNIKYWEGKFAGNFMAKLYEILLKDRLKEEKDWLYIEAHKLYDELKAFMAIYR